MAPDGTTFFFARNPDGMGTRDPNQRVYAVRDGRELWHMDLEGDYTGRAQIHVARNGSVVLTGALRERKRKIFGVGLGERVEHSYLMALDPADGAVRWKQPVASSAPTPHLGLNKLNFLR